MAVKIQKKIVSYEVVTPAAAAVPVAATPTPAPATPAPGHQRYGQK
ncbi:MAG: hypothetical protein H7831_09695 [Magnetococcus sp. WYHC-3]